MPGWPTARIRRLALFVGLALLGPWGQGPLFAQAAGGATDPVVGPARGTLVVAGGGELGSDIWDRFMELAGGENARIVVIPTAAGDRDLSHSWHSFEALRDAGAERLVLLHTRDPREANLASFVSPLRDATAVWLPGGRPWRLVDAYLHTRVHDELFELLERGGVVGGTSAGASIQGSFLMRGDPETNRTIYSEEYPEGFGFLNSVAVDQHLLTREREEDLPEVLATHPGLRGIGLDEGTALIVSGDRAEVIGVSQVLVYGGDRPLALPRRFGAGSAFDLESGRPIVSERLSGPTRAVAFGASR